MGCGGSKPESSKATDASGDNLAELSSINLAEGSISILPMRSLNYEAVMHDDDGVQAMIDFATSEFAEENMLFWAACQKFAKASADDQLARLGAEIVDKFLCAEAEMQVNLPSALSKPFAASSSKGSYTWSKGMFGAQGSGQLGEIYKLIRNDTFNRFKFSDRAKELLEEKPSLSMGHAAEAKPSEDDAALEALDGLLGEGSVALARQSRADTSLGATLRGWVVKCGCARVTLWMIHQQSGRMFNVSSTELGNAMISIPLGIGLAGGAAKDGSVVFIADAYADPTFNREVDTATGFRTRQVCCVPLRREHGAPVIAVAQLINKREGKGDVFTQADVDAVTSSLPALLPKLSQYENTRVSRWGDVVA